MGRVRKTDRKELTVVKRAQIWTRYIDGYGFTAISKLEKTPYSTVRSIIQRRLKTGNTSFEIKPRRGPSKKTSDRDDRALIRHANQNLKDTLYALATPSKSGYKLGRNTIRKILKEHFIPFYRRIVEKYGPSVVIQEDNAPWHTAKVVRKYIAR